MPARIMACMQFANSIVRVPGRSFCQALSAVGAQPDIAKALEQHSAYSNALAECGLQVTTMAADENHPDGTFVEDTFVIADRVAIATRPGAKTRLGEVAAVAAALGRFRAHCERIEPPGSLDGGDICQVDDHFLIGLSARTNEAGAAQLAGILARHGYTSSTVDIRGCPSLLHLKSGITYLGDRRFLVAPGFPSGPALAAGQRIEVDPAEAYAANAVRVNGHILIAAGFPRLATRLASLSYRIRALEMSEFEKMDGGLSCLSLRF
ncbi:MAG TPA: arginine deiminase family protein [Steroidobacteraceae bacterium]|nr:arginine deiminase family protein [Steroidobacteraceae bacterium]